MLALLNFCFHSPRSRGALLFTAIVATAPAAGWAQPISSMRSLGLLPGGTYAQASCISHDGTVIGGTAQNAAGRNRAFIWTEAAGMQDIGTLGGDSSQAYALSADGSVVVGNATNAEGRDRAYRWTQAGGMQDLGTLGGEQAEARAVSADGSVVAGYADDKDDHRRAFRWTLAGGMQDLGTFGGSTSIASAISADGSVVAGDAIDENGDFYAFRWTAESGLQSLGSLGRPGSRPFGISADGSIIVGFATNAAGQQRAFRWTSGEGMQDLGTLGGARASANAISSDGLTIVGHASDAAGRNRAFIWTADQGMQDIGTLGGTAALAFAVADGGAFVVGLSLDAQSASLAFLWGADTDGDGIPDDWEQNGVPYTDPDGTPRRFLIDLNGDNKSDADWRHKDLFIEIDSLPGWMIPAKARQMVIDAFADAPVANPDGIDGITLHLQISDPALVSATPWTTDANGWPPEFDRLKQDHFGSGSPEQRAAKARVFRYAICADTIDDGSLGTAELPGNDFFTSLGELSDPPTDVIQASTFMHELGHTLGLRHGGGDNINGKPNYISVMNYVLADPYPFSEDFWRLDYSREALPTLRECCLSEHAGIPSKHSTEFFMPFGVPDDPDGRLVRYVALDGSPTDWNDDGKPVSESVPQDLNYLGPDVPYAGVANPSFPQNLHGHNDWANVQLRIGTTGDFQDLVHQTIPRDEPTAALIEWARANMVGPAPDCVADWDGNGVVNSQDFFDFLAAFFETLPSADINADGVVNSQDFFDFLAAFFEGC